MFLKDASFKDEIVEAARENTSEVTFLVRKEVTRICDVCTQLSSDVTSTFQKAEENMLAPLEEVRSDLQLVKSSVDMFDQRIKELEKTTTEIKHNLTNTQSSSNTSMELKNALQTFTNAHLVNQTMLKDDLKKKLNTLTEVSERQSSIMDTLQNEMVIQGGIRKVLLDFNKALVDQIVSESQITREVIQNMRKTRNTYKCDFHILNFSKWSGSGEECFSRLWYIDQAFTHVKADVIFNGDMTISVGLAHGRYPKVVGLDPYPGMRVKVKVSAVKQSGTDDNWDLGAGEIKIDEKQIPPECDGWLSVSGWGLADVSCEELRTRGLIEDDMLILRYIIAVVQ